MSIQSNISYTAPRPARTTSSINAINATHDLALRSWVDSANLDTTDFPIQNLPFGRFRRAGTQEPLRIGVAIGDQALDSQAIGLVTTDDMNEVMANEHSRAPNAASGGL